MECPHSGRSPTTLHRGSEAMLPVHKRRPVARVAGCAAMRTLPVQEWWHIEVRSKRTLAPQRRLLRRLLRRQLAEHSSGPEVRRALGLTVGPQRPDPPLVGLKPRQGDLLAAVRPAHAHLACSCHARKAPLGSEPRCEGGARGHRISLIAAWLLGFCHALVAGSPSLLARAQQYAEQQRVICSPFALVGCWLVGFYVCMFPLARTHPAWFPFRVSAVFLYWYSPLSFLSSFRGSHHLGPGALALK